jgi:hypothetical protein
MRRWDSSIKPGPRRWRRTASIPNSPWPPRRRCSPSRTRGFAALYRRVAQGRFARAIGPPGSLDASYPRPHHAGAAAGLQSCERRRDAAFARMLVVTSSTTKKTHSRLCPCPQRVDAVEKLGDERRARNKRIWVNGCLNQRCVRDSPFESKLLVRSPRIFFQQHRSRAAVPATSELGQLFHRKQTNR